MELTDVRPCGDVGAARSKLEHGCQHNFVRSGKRVSSGDPSESCALNRLLPPFDDIERRVREFVNAGYRRDHDNYGLLSLDVPIFGDSTITLGDTITSGFWQ